MSTLTSILLAIGLAAIYPLVGCWSYFKEKDEIKRDKYE